MKDSLILTTFACMVLLVGACSMQAKPTPEEVAGVVAKRFQKLGIRFVDLTVSDLNCAYESPKWRCTFTNSARDLDFSKSDSTGKEVYNDKLTVTPNVQLTLIKGDGGWMETR
ncbi:hypothetical protein HZ993_12795 [Rhodoferax sp. AJA081-3]|uniref:hypothetical protein n=1 Tax=Rhodoferax sp. AJA081-3 TaxID=2752316 RepID=UPI001ADFE019|nr:hypothetical protein [Rhodoferax sp. AJA081-3]QTN26223.1 hypothetical protein HZ993_12795 [Rhodoferax sp. AJA081-3]